MRPPCKVYAGLSAPLLISGVEPLFLFINVWLLLFWMVVFGMKALWWAPATYVIHKLLQSLTKSDLFLRKIYVAYHFQSDRYEPWVESHPRRGLRQIDLGRGLVM